jgi:hypothetical protein
MASQAGAGATGWPLDCSNSMNDPDSHVLMATFFAFYIFFRHISPITNFDEERGSEIGQVQAAKKRGFGLGTQVIAFIVLFGGVFSVGWSRFVLGAASIDHLLLAFLLGGWLLFTSFWIIDPSLRTFIAKLKIHQLTLEERVSARNCVLIWNFAAYLVYMTIFIIVDNLGVFALNSNFDAKKCSPPSTPDDAAWRNSILAGLIMVGFGSIYGAIHHYNPENDLF